MTDTICLLAMVYSRDDFYFWADPLPVHIRSAITVPEGVRLTDVQVINCPYAVEVLENLHRLTYKPNPVGNHGEMFRENLVVEISLETPEPLRYTEIPWIVRALTSYADRPENQPCGVYCFYLRKNDDVIWFQPMARCVTNQVVIDDIDDDEDLSYLQRHAEFLDDILYHGGPSDRFMPTAALLTLQFGEEVPRRMVDLF